MRQVAKRGILTAVATGSVLASTAGYAYANAEAQGAAVNSAGVGSGNAVQAPVDIPVNACGNTVNVVGLLNPAMGNNCGNASRSMPVHPHSAPMNHGPAGPGNSDQWHPGEGHLHPGASMAGASAVGAAHNSPGVGSGNNVQAPVTIPVNACGNSVDVVGLANPAFGNSCGNQSTSTPAPPAHTPPGHTPPGHTPPPPGHTPPPPGDDCGPGTPNPQPPVVTPPTDTPPPVSTPPAGTPPVEAPPGTGRTGGPPEVTPVSTNTATPGTENVRIPAQSVQSPAMPAARGQLASTGASGIELMGSAGAALMLAGGVLYRRSRAGAR